jgi:DNA-binding NarL/FixJ family response regulator
MSARHGETGMRAIVVDDYQPFLAALAVLLSHKTGVEVVGQADNGVDGLKLIEEMKPDLVLVDYTMPGIGGVEVTRRLKAMPGGPKVIVMSFQTEMECREQAFKAGADGFLVKTEMHQELLPLLRSIGA